VTQRTWGRGEPFLKSIMPGKSRSPSEAITGESRRPIRLVQLTAPSSCKGVGKRTLRPAVSYPHVRNIVSDLRYGNDPVGIPAAKIWGERKDRRKESRNSLWATRAKKRHCRGCPKCPHRGAFITSPNRKEGIQECREDMAYLRST